MGGLLQPLLADVGADTFFDFLADLGIDVAPVLEDPGETGSSANSSRRWRPSILAWCSARAT
jgi:hypothetical protein